MSLSLLLPSAAGDSAQSANTQIPNRRARRLAAISPRSFDRILLLEPKGETSASVSIGDLNGDGYPDLVLGKGRHWPLLSRVLLNDGKGHFTAHDLGNTPNRTYSAALADVDRDGHLDVVISDDQPDRKLVYLNDGKGNFHVSGTFGDPKWPTRYVALADLTETDIPTSSSPIAAIRRGIRKRVTSVSTMAKDTSRRARPWPGRNPRRSLSRRTSMATALLTCLCRIATGARV